VVITRDQTAETGNVAYTGIGFQPKAIKLFASNGQSNVTISQGYDNAQSYGGHTIKGTTVANMTVGSIYIGDAATWAQYGNIQSFNADGFTIAWTKFGTPPAGTITILCKPFG
jgi:hypothetical protein